MIADRVGVDVEPLDLADPDVLAWLAACVPPEAGAVTRFAAASALARATPARTVRGNLLDVLPEVIASLPADALVCLVDTYVHVFLPPAELHRFDKHAHRARPRSGVGVDRPARAAGTRGSGHRAGARGSRRVGRENREGGVSGVIGRVSVRDGERRGTVLGRAHPGAAWLEWQ